MDENIRLAAKIKREICKFSGIISTDFTEAKRKIIKELLFGIQASKDVKLSNICRALKEDQRLIKTEDRLSRNLDDIDFTDSINETICRLASARVLEDMVIALDPGDIRKKHAKHMEFLARIHDGSEKEIGDGYWLCKAVAADLEHKLVIPLYCEAYSQKSPDFKSENTQLLKAIDCISKYLGDKGIIAIDRGGDRTILFYKFLKNTDKPKRFVIRLCDRDLLHKGIKKNCKEIAASLPCQHEAKIIKYEEGKEKTLIIKYGAIKVKLPKYKQNLVMVVVKGFGIAPMMLLTSCKINFKTKESIWRIVEIYITRWKCEESFRYIKQCYNLEDIRVRDYVSIRNIVVLVSAVAYFAAVYLGQNLKLKILIEKIFICSKRFFTVPSFFNYAMADGIYNLLFPDKMALNLKSHRNLNEFQLVFDFG